MNVGENDRGEGGWVEVEVSIKVSARFWLWLINARPEGQKSRGLPLVHVGEKVYFYSIVFANLGGWLPDADAADADSDDANADDDYATATVLLQDETAYSWRGKPYYSKYFI